MGKFEYLGAVVPYTILIYFLFVCCIASIYHCCSCSRKPRTKRDREFNDTVYAMDRTPAETVVYHLSVYFEGDSFETTYQSCCGKMGTYVLLLVRLCAFFYMCGVNVVVRHTLDPMFGVFFTAWNVDLLALYFFLASVSSIIGISYDISLRDFQEAHIGHEANAVNFWSTHILRFGYAVQILYEIAGSTAFFVTVIAFALLNPQFQFWNVSIHFITSMVMLLELSLNNINVRWEHMLMNLAWALIYLIFCWPMVRFGAMTEWPYFFLRSKSAFVFVWYIILIVVDIIFFYLFWTLSLCKYMYLDWREGNTGIREETAQYPSQEMTNATKPTKDRQLVRSAGSDIEMSHDQIYGNRL